jgi:SAM-dependent methyltransferase
VGSGKKLTRDHWFEDIADHLGSAYLRYSFTKGTRQETDFIIEATGIALGARVLDVGCGPGRHSLELARRGFEVEGIDISEPFVELARSTAQSEGLSNATFSRVDARLLADDGARRGAFDAVICLCQGAFGLMRSPDDDRRVFAGLSTVLRPGGVLVLSAFNAYFQIRHHVEAGFDAASGVGHERTSVRSPSGEEQEVDLWTGCYTPKELALLADHHGLSVLQMYGVEPGAFGPHAPSVDLPEYLLVARRQAVAGSV